MEEGEEEGVISNIQLSMHSKFGFYELGHKSDASNDFIMP